MEHDRLTGRGGTVEGMAVADSIEGRKGICVGSIDRFIGHFVGLLGSMSDGCTGFVGFVGGQFFGMGV